MKNFKKLMSLLLVVVMVFAMSANAFAATGGPNFTKSDASEWSTPVTAGSSVTLMVGPADSSYYYTGFATSEEAAEKVPASAWTVNYGAGNFTYTVGTAADTNYYGEACYAATITITPNADYYGPISVHAVPTDATSAWTYVDMTVYSEAPSTVDIADATGVYVEVADVRSEANVLADLDGISVVPAGDGASTNPFKNAEACAQSYPTAMGALANLVAANKISVSANAGYIQTITPVGGTALTAYTDESWNYYGWNYCVIRDDAIVEESSMISASVLPVQSGDIVIWAFGTTTQASAYFNALIG